MPLCHDVSEVCDWELMCRKIDDLRPLLEPGTKTFYHAITFSWIIGETARRLDGRNISAIIHDEICRPLGIDSIFTGIPDSRKNLVAALTSPSGIPVSELPGKFGLGYALYGPDENYGQSFGHGGYGGTVGSADAKTGLAIGITKNRTNTAAPNLADEIRATLNLQ